MEENMRVIGVKILSVVMVGNYYQMVHNMKDIMLEVNHMDKENLLGLVVNGMKENGIKEWRKVKVIRLINIKDFGKVWMDNHIMENGKIIKHVVMENTYKVMVIDMLDIS